MGTDRERPHGNIVLSGFMGSGKSTIGRRLAAALGMKFVDMDRYIEEKTGLKVREIFDRFGEAHFRALETETVRALSARADYVVATGGGTVYFLDVPLAALQERLKNDRRRPLLQVPDRRAVIERLLSERRPQYLESADVVVDAGAPTVVVVRRICALRGVELPKRAAQPQGGAPAKEKRRRKRRRRRRPAQPQENA